MHFAFARRGEDQPGFGLVRRGIHSPGNRKRLQHFSVVGVDHHKLLRLSPRREQPPAATIPRPPRPPPPGGDPPAPFLLLPPRITPANFPPIFPILVDTSLSLPPPKLRT